MGEIKREIDSFTVGGTAAGPSLPGPRLQSMLGTRIKIGMITKSLIVQTPSGMRTAERGDRVVLYDDDTLDVQSDRK